jgi:release factor glutamine methyltransferase
MNREAPTVAQALDEARAAGVDRLDAQLLLAHTLGQGRSWLLAHGDVMLDAAQADAYRSALDRRANGEPLAYLFGAKDFHGLALQVDKQVLVPRPDTETLVDWAIELLTTELRTIAAPRVIDLGTGSGAIALAVKHAAPRAHVEAADLSDDALTVAASNARRLGLDVDFVRSHWWQGFGGRSFDLALSNPPYIAIGDRHLAALVHEPAMALVSGPDGLDAIREIVAGAAPHIAPGGWLLLEHGHDQAHAVNALLESFGFDDIGSRHDLAGIVRCSGGRRAGPREAK